MLLSYLVLWNAEREADPEIAEDPGLDDRPSRHRRDGGRALETGAGSHGC
jgi:hypothetical protein